MRPWLVLPVKPLDQGKSRLAPHLSPAARRELNHELFLRLLKLAAGYVGADRTVVVSRCDEARRLAHLHSSRTIAETEPSLNAAVAQAVDAVQQHDRAPVLIVSCDLPLLREEDLCHLVQPGKVVVATDRAGMGTNALGLPAGAAFRFHYGHASRLRHVQEAKHRGLSWQVLERPALAFDLDSFRDYCEWKQILSIS